MATSVVLNVILEVLTMLFVGSAILCVYYRLCEVCATKLSFLIYCMILACGVFTFIYNIGRVVLIWY